MAEQPDSFTIAGTDGGASLTFEGVVQRDLTGYDGFKFVARAAAQGLAAAFDVYDIRPDLWTQFFAGLAKNWSGWSGERAHESLEQQVRLACRADRAGQVAIRVELSDGDTELRYSICTEAGQLAALARSAEAYFGPPEVPRTGPV